MCLIKRRCNMKEKVCVISQHDKNLMYTAVHFTDSQGSGLFTSFKSIYCCIAK